MFNFFSLIELVINCPWKAINEIKRLLIYPLARLRFRLAGIKWGNGWKIYGLPILQVHRGSQILIGDYLELRSSVESNPLSPFHPVMISTRSKEAVVQIGDHFSMTGGSLVAQKKITIGNHVMIGANSLIIDTDFHPLNSAQRREVINTSAAEPIVVRDDVFIGTQVIILKGVRIPARQVIGAGKVINSHSIFAKHEP